MMVFHCRKQEKKMHTNSLQMSNSLQIERQAEISDKIFNKLKVATNIINIKRKKTKTKENSYFFLL